jgi:tetratricopeptide (TPR) repeat protein
MFTQDPQFSQTYYLASKLYTQTKNSTLIKPLFQTAFNQGIRDSVIIDLLPKLYLDNQEIEKSISFFETLITENNSLPHHKKALAELYKQIGKYTESIDIIDQLVSANPEYIQDACSLCTTILSTHPQLSPIRLKLIHFSIKNCDPDTALNHLNIHLQNPSENIDTITTIFNTLLDIFPGHTQSLYAYCNFLLTKQKTTEAINILTLLLQTPSNTK